MADERGDEAIAALRATLADKYLRGCYNGEGTRLAPSLEMPKQHHQQQQQQQQEKEGTVEESGMDVFAYLKRVRAEENRIPTVVSANGGRAAGAGEGTEAGTAAGAVSKKTHPLLRFPVMANEYDVALHSSMLPSGQWQRDSVAGFADARTFLARWETRDICERFGLSRPEDDACEDEKGSEAKAAPVLMSISVRGGMGTSGLPGVGGASSVAMPMRSSDKPQRFLPLPPFRDLTSWKRLCFGGGCGEGERGGEEKGEGEGAGAGGEAAAAAAGGGKSDHRSDNNGSGKGAKETKARIFSSGIPPLTSLLLQIDQPGIYKLLKLHVSWLQGTAQSSVDGAARTLPPPLSRARAAWLYALLARMDKPLPPAKAATTRDLLRELKKRRSFVCATTLAAGTESQSGDGGGGAGDGGEKGSSGDQVDRSKDGGGGAGANVSESESDTDNAVRARQEALRLARINLLISVIEISFGQGDQY